VFKPDDLIIRLINHRIFHHLSDPCNIIRMDEFPGIHLNRHLRAPFFLCRGSIQRIKTIIKGELIPDDIILPVHEIRQFHGIRKFLPDVIKLVNFFQRCLREFTKTLLTPLKIGFCLFKPGNILDQLNGSNRFSIRVVMATNLDHG